MHFAQDTSILQGHSKSVFQEKKKTEKRKTKKLIELQHRECIS